MSLHSRRQQDTLREAVREAERFTKRAKEAIARLDRDEMAVYGSPETAAAKRASMDLTRALVKVRANNQ